MSSLFIPGMKKPERCSMCPAYHLIEVPKAWLDPDPIFKVKPFCTLTQEDIEDIRNVNRNCPLVEIQTPHGRLIDGDELLGFFMNHAWDWSSVDGITTTTALKQMISDLKHAPTIIEAEE